MCTSGLGYHPDGLWVNDIMFKHARGYIAVNNVFIHELNTLLLVYLVLEHFEFKTFQILIQLNYKRKRINISYLINYKNDA